MRLIHTADWHLGARLGTQDRLSDQLERLEALMGHVDREAADVLLVAGDFVDAYQTAELERVLRPVGELLAPRLAGGLVVAVVAGNHDREQVFPLLAALQRLLDPSGSGRLILADRPALRPVTTRRGEPLDLLLLPYPTAARYSLPDRTWSSPEERRRRLAEQVSEVASGLALDRAATERGPAAPTVLIGHFLASGSQFKGREMDERVDVPVSIDGLPPVVYAALGHIHLPQLIGGDELVRYCGALDRMRRDEAELEPQALLVELVDRSVTAVRGLPLGATPIVHLQASTTEELEVVAATLPEPARTLVTLDLTLTGAHALGPLLDQTARLFPRLYQTPHVTWLDGPVARPADGGLAAPRRTVEETVRDYLSSQVPEGDEREALLALADELLAARTKGEAA